MIDTPIRDLLAAARKPLLSFEFFPPRDDRGMESLQRAAQRLLMARPDFVSVTYGAGGSTRERTFEVCGRLREMGFSPVMPHLTCVGVGRAELTDIVDEIHERGYRNVMALRGDPPEGETEFRPLPDGLSHAADLVALIKERHPDIGCGVAGYPEMHPEAPSLAVDIEYLRRKVEAGADFVTTQLFFENEAYTAFLARCRAAGIRAPIVPGLLPAISLPQARRMTERCRARLPEALVGEMAAAGGDTPQAETIGIRWAERQVEELFSRGAPGIHLYVLNRSKVALSPEFTDCFARFRG